MTTNEFKIRKLGELLYSLDEAVETREKDACEKAIRNLQRFMDMCGGTFAMKFSAERVLESVEWYPGELVIEPKKGEQP